MVLNILVSFSLLALVVTARPISDAPQSVRKSLEVQNAVQAILASRTGQHPDYLAYDDEDDVHISLTSAEEQSAVLSRLNDLDAIKAIIPLNVHGTPTQDEKQLYDILKALRSSASSLQDLDGGERPLSENLVSAPLADTESDKHASAVHETIDQYPSVGPADIYSSTPLIVLAVSCLAAFLAVVCVGAGLYAMNHLKSAMLKSGSAWDVLPRLERRVGLDGPDGLNVNLGDGAQQPEKRRLLSGDAPLLLPVLDEEKTERGLDEKASASDEPFSDDEGMDEKFEDAQEHSLLFLDADVPPQYQSRPEVPQIVIEQHPDPDLLPLPDIPSDQSTPFSTPLRTPLRTPFDSPTRSPARRAPQMRELQSSPTPASKPLWSLRASDAPALGLASPSSSSPTLSRAVSPAPQLPGALYSDDALEMMVEVPRPRQRTTPRQPLDIAFALQLRPGLGLGSDSAWIVRFLMTMFGWMTVLIGGGGARREDTRRALTA
ncbi:hypothetical protein BV20DRAFT_974836 [Pilatotrama ljubarskyi]|nr:hypothetical protein BV20DRAFT_974836 [Pilatotrama ljubarskyi]